MIKGSEQPKYEQEVARQNLYDLTVSLLLHSAAACSTKDNFVSLNDDQYIKSRLTR